MSAEPVTTRPTGDPGERLEVVRLVDDGWTSASYVTASTHRLLTYPDGSVAFEHYCRVVDGMRLVTAPRLQLDAGHHVVSRDPWTVRPSILCPDCGTHGFVRDGRWVAA